MTVVVVRLRRAPAILPRTSVASERVVFSPLEERSSSKLCLASLGRTGFAGRGARSAPQAREDARREKGATEIVYELYGLTDEEIEIVEEAVGN